MTAAVTTHRLPDGSTCEVEVIGPRSVLISRFVNGERVWGQGFSHGSSEGHDEQVSRVIADMTDRPGDFTRRDLWDADGRAVR